MKGGCLPVSFLALFLVGCSGQVSKPSFADSPANDRGAFEATLEGAFRFEIPDGVGYHRENRGFYWITLGHDFPDGHVAIDFLRKGKERFEVGRYDLESAPFDDSPAPLGVTANFYGKGEKYFEYPIREGFLQITSASNERIDGRFEFTAVGSQFIAHPLREISEDQKVRVRGSFQAVAANR
ncbi:MAG TPA: hypothetical protein VMN76_05825 [Acidobacteriota bacterium]|nr:hypothetical protein [Acidobacteriota bacterium]